jgi:hypothetical protein
MGGIAVHRKALIGFALATGVAALLPRPAAAQPVLPEYEITTIVRSMGLAPLSRPIQQGPTFVVRVGDPYGHQLTVTLDARVGRVLSVRRIAAIAPYDRPSGYVPMTPQPPAPYEAPDQFGPSYAPPADGPRVIYGRDYGAVAHPPAPVPGVKTPAAKSSKSAASPLPKSAPKETAAAPKDSADDATATTGSIGKAATEPQAAAAPAIPPVQGLE